MPWFRVDDSAHSHPKWVKAGNAALGLWVRCGSYSAHYLTEGIIPGEIARQYGTAPQAAKLVHAGLWHERGHACPRCPQPGADEYVMHDFFEDGRNTTKAQAEASKEAAAERQRRRRAKQNTDFFADDSSSKRERIEDENDPKKLRKEPPFEDLAAGQEHMSRRDTGVHGSGVSRPPKPATKPVAPTELQKASRPERAPTRSEIPEWATPLVHHIHAAGLPGLRWNLASADWLIIDALIKAKGVEAMADYAARAAQSSAKPVVSARYFLAGWKELPNRPPDGHARAELRMVAGGASAAMSTTDQRIAEHSALTDRLRARENQETQDPR